MGYSPLEVDRMSVFQFLAARDGFVEAHGGGEQSLTPEEQDALWDFINE